MTGEVELVSDGDGVVVAGDRSAVERFLAHVGFLDQVQEFDLGTLSSIVKIGATAATTVSGIVEQSGMYLKLTPESAKRFKDAGGLMKTKTKGISHAMLGETGKKSLKWLQVEDGPGSLLTNPAVLSGVGSLMSQFAQQSEAQELKALLARIDEKLDDVRRAQRDAVLAKMRSGAAAIDEAMTIRARLNDRVRVACGPERRCDCLRTSWTGSVNVTVLRHRALPWRVWPRCSCGITGQGEYGSDSVTGVRAISSASSGNRVPAV